MALLFLGTTATALPMFSSSGRAALDGAGNHECSLYVKAMADKSPDARIYVGWIDGYMSGVNVSRRDTYDITPWQTTELVATMVQRHCQRHPDMTLGDATGELVRALFANRLAKEVDIVQIRANGQAVFLYRNVIGDLNRALSAAGYAVPEGNEFSEQTQAALKQYQAKNKLPISGLPDQPTLFTLFVRQQQAD